MLRVEIAMEMNKAVGGKWEEGITLFHPLCSVHLWICGYAHIVCVGRGCALHACACLHDTRGQHQVSSSVIIFHLLLNLEFISLARLNA